MIRIIFIFNIIISIIAQTIINPTINGYMSSTAQVTAPQQATQLGVQQTAQLGMQQAAQQAAQLSVQQATQQAASRIVNAAAGVCTRTTCYTTIEETVKNAIVSETNKEITYLNGVIDAKFSSYTGPLVAVAIATPNIIDKIKNNDFIGAVGITADALLKYKVGITAFGSCAAYTAPFIGPFSILPGFGCSIVSSFIVNNAYETAIQLIN
jgi:hypothetical protein